MKTGKMFVMTCVLGVVLLCTLGAVFDLQGNTVNTTNYFAASAQNGNYTYENVSMPWEEYSNICCGAYCILYIIILIVWIFVIVWVYKDAEKRGKSGILWAIIVFFTGIIGLIIWFVVRPKQIAGAGYGPPVQPYQPLYQPPYQPQYQAPPSPAATICPTCGRPATYIQQYNRWYCYNCGKYL
jgi:hypothetical protein